MVRWLERLSRGLGRLEQGVLALCLAVMITFAFLQMLLRLLPGDQAVSWLEPVARQLVIWVGLLGASLATAEGRHISIEAVPKLLTTGQKQGVAVLIGLLAGVAALLLAALAWVWFVEVDREEAAVSAEIVHVLRGEAKALSGKPRDEAIATLSRRAERRVNLARLRGFARLIRARQITALRLEDLDPNDKAFVAPARTLIADDARLKGASIQVRASLVSAEWIAGHFEQAAEAYGELGNRDIGRELFASAPAGPDIATAVGDRVARSLYDVVERMTREADVPAPTALRARARLERQQADQKAFLRVGGVVVHEWMFHAIVPISLLIMSLRFFLSAFVALVLTTDQYEAREAELLEGIETFENPHAEGSEFNDAEAGSDADEGSGSDDDSELDDDSDSDRLPSERRSARRARESSKRKPEPPVPDVPPGALETVEILDHTSDMFDEVDKSLPPKNRPVPKPQLDSDDLLKSEGDLDDDELSGDEESRS